MGLGDGQESVNAQYIISASRGFSSEMEQKTWAAWDYGSSYLHC